MSFHLSDQTAVSHVTLRVRDLAKMTDFYHNIIGLTIFEQTSKVAHLGLAGDDNVRLTLRLGYDTTRNLNTTGLYHTAWVQPTRQNLANQLQHYQIHHIPVFLAADHRFSQSLYVWDPEMNAVEVYYDLPRETWLILPNGRMPQRTIQLDTSALLKEANGQWEGLAVKTRLGHIHLRVSHLTPSTDFYQQLLGFDLKDWETPHASFLAADGYHHHVALNGWHGPYPEMAPNQTGLMDFTITVGSAANLQALNEHLVSGGWPVTNDNARLSLLDPDHNQIFIDSLDD